jgi:hypothetical protein
MGNGLQHSTNKEKRTSLYDALYYCLAIFFTIPLPDLKPAGRYRYVPLILRAIAWTLFALLIATLGKVMIRRHHDQVGTALDDWSVERDCELKWYAIHEFVIGS